MTTTKFEDADLTHPWAVAYRIPLIKQVPYPRWKYEIALVVPADGEAVDDFIHSIWPTETEAKIIAAAIEYRVRWYREGYRAKMRERALDVDGSTNTLVLVKKDDGWHYRRASWTSGPMISQAYPDLSTMLGEELGHEGSRDYDSSGWSPTGWTQTRAEIDEILRTAAE